MSPQEYQYKIPFYDSKADKSQEFQNHFIKEFKRGRPIVLDMKEYLNDYSRYKPYVSNLYKAIKNDYLKEGDTNKLFIDYNNFKTAYSSYFRWGVYNEFVKLLMSRNKYEDAFSEWNYLRSEEYKSMNFTFRENEIKELVGFESLIGRKVVNPLIIENLSLKGSQRTKFGLNNRENVNKVLAIILSEIDSGFFRQFFDTLSYNKVFRKLNFTTYPREYYFKYFQHSKKYKKELEWLLEADTKLLEKRPLKYLKPENFFFSNNVKDKPKFNFVCRAIQSEASRLLRESENEYRKIIGAKAIGEGWISETELYYKIKKAFSSLMVEHHGRPEWLGRQHFDIWIPEANIAIEYQGRQHDEPIEYFGGEEGHKNSLKRDKKKKLKCEKNAVELIEVRPGYDFSKLIETINSYID